MWCKQWREFYRNFRLSSLASPDTAHYERGGAGGAPGHAAPGGHLLC